MPKRLFVTSINKFQLAAVINGYGGPGLLESYELERRPVAFLSVEHSKSHMDVHNAVSELLKPDSSILDSDTDEGCRIRHRIHRYYQDHDGENKDLGVEMGFRYHSHINVLDGTPEPIWTPSAYIPSTLPGARAPHVFLKDGSAIFDLYGEYWTLVDFADNFNRGGKLLVEAAHEKSIPVKHVILHSEDHAAKIWGKPLVLVRPDGHISWRSDFLVDQTAARQIIETVTGMLSKALVGEKEMPRVHESFTISGSGIITSQSSSYSLERMGEMQN